MGMFTRLGDIVSSNINALLDRLEDPERTLAQLIREMEESLTAARQHALAVIAQERRLARDERQQRDLAAGWKAKARLALDTGREDLARRALARHLEQLDAADGLKAQHATAHQNSSDAQLVLRALEDRLQQARGHHRLLKAGRHSKAVQHAWSAAAGFGDARSPFVRFGHLERRLLELEDHLVIHAQIASAPAETLEEELGKLDMDRRTSEALTALKGGFGASA